MLEDDEINGYFENVISTVKTNGYAIFAEFSKKGAAKCAGLKLHRYSIEELSERLGSTFMLEYQFEDTYINPFGGKRPYIYTLFKKKG